MAPIIYVPIEPLTERYTEQWYRKFPEAFRAAGHTVVIIDGKPLLQNEIKVGAFLDINSTVAYKNSQLQEIARMFHHGEIADGTIFFFGDVEFWGLESVRVMADLNKVRIHMTGFLHAASYTTEDAFAVAAAYQQFTEIGWFAALDKIFVGSLYHKRAVLSRRLVPMHAEYLARKFVVTKNPLFLDEYHDFGLVHKQQKVVLANRFDPEKRPSETLHLFERLKENYPDWEFTVITSRPTMRGSPGDMALLNRLLSERKITVKVGLTKEQYHRELAEAFMVVSHSIEENYGYIVAESIHYGCIPLLRSGLSHDEFVGSHYQFYNNVDAFAKATSWMECFDEPLEPLELDSSGMKNILREIATLT